MGSAISSGQRAIPPQRTIHSVMGPPRRNPPHSTSISQMGPQHSPPYVPQRTPAQEQGPLGSQSPTTSQGMSPASRYNYNLKVLRRRDPSIISIFDQFSHVCVYHHDGQQWSKHGYEGSMFLFERDAYPPYGFYILNRVGMDDYISHLHPEDETFDQGSVLIIRSYPDFLARRLADIESSTSGETPDKFSDIYAIPNIEELRPKQKGRFFNIGLWMQSIDSRESMSKVIQRLHSYVKKNLPYPQEFRYGPGKPPPPHRLRAVPRNEANDSDLSDSQSHQSIFLQSDSEDDQGHKSTHSASSGNLSSVERLFANLDPHPQSSAPAATATIDSLFASAMDKRAVEYSVPTPPPTKAGTGISLLDTIFASADPNRSTTVSSPNGSVSQSTSSMSPSLKPRGSFSTIYSPQPSFCAASPQILNQDVISGLLGYPPTRTASAASTTYSLGAVSHPSSREGDNEDNSEGDVSPRDRMSKSPHLDNGSSEVGIVFDMDLGGGADHQRTNGFAIAGSDPLTILGLPTLRRQTSRGRINGDVTPRGPLTRPGGSHRLHSTAIEATSSVSTVRGQSEPIAGPLSVLSTVSAPSEAKKPRPHRTLVPFAPDSELWPYTQGLVQENSHSDLDDDGEDGGIVELSFEETSVLSDPEAFRKALLRKKSGLNGVEVSVNGHRTYMNGASSSFSEKDKGRKSKKSKRERDAITRREIEDSWDIPPPSPANAAASRSFNMLPVGPPASPSPCASPELSNTSLGVTSISGPEMMRTPTMTAKATLGNPAITTTVQAKANGTLNSISPMKNSGVDAECVMESIVAAVEAQPKPVGRMDKAEFLSEVLSLIYNETAFVDTLWQQYMARLA